MGKQNNQKMTKMTDAEKRLRDAEAAAVMQFVQKARRLLNLHVAWSG